MEPSIETLAERVQGDDSATAPDNRRRDLRFQIPGGLVRTPCKPFQVNGAELDARTLLFGVLPSFFRHRYDLVNVSKGGLAFESRWPVSRGATLRVQLWLPGEPAPLELVGETRWCTRLPYGLFRVGVQFSPYGNGPGMNAPSALNALRELEAKYADEPVASPR
ncbi:MAG TPA: PilZ domain-containing protein [Polyangiales bacterium]|nr:PilZ domain-containing protein [Polyangiales bacterium]